MGGQKVFRFSEHGQVIGPILVAVTIAFESYEANILSCFA